MPFNVMNCQGEKNSSMCIIIYEQWRTKLNYKKMYFNSAKKKATTFLSVQKEFFFKVIGYFIEISYFPK